MSKQLTGVNIESSVLSQSRIEAAKLGISRSAFMEIALKLLIDEAQKDNQRVKQFIKE